MGNTDTVKDFPEKALRYKGSNHEQFPLFSLTKRHIL
jgi:hypothetical protein